MPKALGNKQDRKLVIVLVVASVLSAIVTPIVLTWYQKLRAKVG